MLRALARPSTRLALAGGGACLASYSLLERSRCAGSVAPGLDPKAFKPLTLTKITPLTADTAIYRFAYDDAEAVSGMTVASCLLTKAPIGSVKEDGSRANVIRPYTPLSRPNVKGHLDLAVKTYEQGKMSKHIGEMKVGDTLDFKGPILKIAYKKNEFSEIGMVAGGTGITPMLQVVDEILDDPNDKTKVSLIFGNQTDSDILLKAEIDARAAAHPGRFKVHYMVDKPTGLQAWKGGVGYVTEATLKEHMPAPAASSMVYVCGPPPMYKAVCGPKGTKEDPKAQGELGGLLKEMGYTNVFKF